MEANEPVDLLKTKVLERSTAAEYVLHSLLGDDKVEGVGSTCSIAAEYVLHSLSCGRRRAGVGVKTGGSRVGGPELCV